MPTQPLIQAAVEAVDLPDVIAAVTTRPEPSSTPIVARRSMATRASGRRSLAVPLFCSALLASSALLFLAELMFARMVLPLLGGTPAVWNTCMVSFQALLLAAYAYGHWSIRILGVRRQAVLHVLGLALAAIALPIGVPDGWRLPPAGSTPIPWLISVLLAGVGLPFFALASTAPVLQRWFSSTGHRAARDPYFLYAASNVGSMAALAAFPLLFEPLLRLADQSRLWSIGYAALAALVAACACFILRVPSEAHAGLGDDDDGAAALPVAALANSANAISLGRRLRWVALAAVPSSLLLGTTTFVTTDIAAVPLLWVVPLAIYLLSFILVFASNPVLPHRLMVRLLPVVVLGVVFFMLGRVAQPVGMVLALHLAALFVASMVCHGELAADRPSADRLTDFYLTMSLGGVIGGLFNALLAPVIFKTAAEYPIALVAACALCPRVSRRERGKGVGIALDLAIPLLVVAAAWGMPRLLVAASGLDLIGLRMLGLGVAVLVAVTAIGRRMRFVASLGGLFVLATVGVTSANGTLLATHRSFFGIHRVVHNPAGPFNDLFHGSTVHGRQLLDGATPSRATTALTYYHRTGPIGRLFLERTAAGRADNVGVVGMGIGSLAAYAGPATHLTYYEIDPAVRWLAQDSGHFTFLKAAADRGADIRTVMGDARLTLRDAEAGAYDLLVIDAFSGDAVPVHLLTREAMRIYLDKLAPGGVLAVHVSNLYLDLKPVCAALAADAGAKTAFQDDLDVTPQESAEGKCASQWVLISRPGKAASEGWHDARWKPLIAPPGTKVWTDDYSNILGAFRWK